MREMWQLPKRSVWSRSKRLLAAAVVVWAVVAVPLVIWLSQRITPAPTPPPQRALTAVEAAAVRYASASLLATPVTLTSTVTSPMAQLQVTETLDPIRRVGQGTVRSGSQTAELLVVGDRILLRGPAPFWSTLGIPTAEPGWVEVGDRLGATLQFPIADAAAALTPGPQAQMDSTTADAPTATFRNGTLTAVFNDSGLTTLTLGNRTTTVARPSGDQLAKLASSPPPEWDKAVATVTGNGGALTVSPAVAPPPPPAAGE